MVVSKSSTLDPSNTILVVFISDIKVLSTYDKKKSAYVAVTVNPSDEFIKQNLMQ